jgi:hypothetical protein
VISNNEQRDAGEESKVLRSKLVSSVRGATTGRRTLKRDFSAQTRGSIATNFAEKRNRDLISRISKIFDAKPEAARI